MKIVAADIGGTKTLLRLSKIQDGTLATIREQRFVSADYGQFEDILQKFLAGQHGIEAACFGLAGPIEGRLAKVTNLPWQMDGDKIAAGAGIAKVKLINDFAAIGYAVPALQADDLLTLQKGSAISHAPIAILGAGTGLGEAILTWCGERYQVIPTEGGHGHFAPTNAQQMELLAFLLKRFNRVSNERLLSGNGVINVFDFLQYNRHSPINAELHQAMQRDDPAKIIAEFAARGEDETAVASMELFSEIYGQCAGDLALTALSRGGVYVAGGIAAKNKQLFQQDGFLRSFNEKGRMTLLMTRMPVHIILNTQVGLIGAEQVAMLLAQGKITV